MKKALVIIALLVMLIILPLGAGACGGGTTITESDINTFKGLLSRMDSVEGKNAAQDAQITTLNNKVAPDLSNYVTLEKYNELLATYNGLLDENSTTSLISRIKVLEDSGGSTPPGTPTGQVTIAISAGETMVSAGTVWLLKVSNGTADFKKVYISAMLTEASSASSNVTTATFTGSSPMSTTAFNPSSFFPAQATCTMIQSISVGYLLMAPGAWDVPITVSLNLACTPVIFWNVAFSPIVTSY